MSRMAVVEQLNTSQQFDLDNPDSVESMRYLMFEVLLPKCKGFRVHCVQETQDDLIIDTTGNVGIGGFQGNLHISGNVINPATG